MSYKIEKEYNGEVTITITPDDEYTYLETYDTESRGLAFLLIKDGFARILTPEGLSKESYDMKNFRNTEGLQITELKEETVWTLPTNAAYKAESN